MPPTTQLDEKCGDANGDQYETKLMLLSWPIPDANKEPTFDHYKNVRPLHSNSSCTEWHQE